MAGIYLISVDRQQEPGLVYVGKGVKPRHRWAEHLVALRAGTHRNPALQKAFNRYGEAALTFQLIEECDERELDRRESHWIGFARGRFGPERVANVIHNQGDVRVFFPTESRPERVVVPRDAEDEAIQRAVALCRGGKAPTSAIIEVFDVHGGRRFQRLRTKLQAAL